MIEPILSIVMLAFNAEKHIHEAIESILNQDFRVFELIIIDDGSTDNSFSIAKSFNDDRIKIYQNEINMGIVFSRNKGIELSKGKYINMMDSDDIALPGKLQKQIAFLEQNSDFGMVGSWVTLIDDNGILLKEKWKLDSKPENISAKMLFYNYFVQSAVIFRRESLPSYNYKKGYEIVEDYKLWNDIQKKWKVWNFPEYLLKYRVHTNSATQSKSTVVENNLNVIYSELLTDFKIDYSEKEIELHKRLKKPEKIEEKQTILDLRKWLEKLLLHNRKIKIYPEKYFASIIFNRWLKTIYLSGNKNLFFLPRLISAKIISDFIFSRFSINKEANKNIYL